MNRREMLLQTGAAAVTLGLSPFPLGWVAAADAPRRRLLMYTHSEAYEHDVVKRKGKQLSLAEQILTELGSKHNFDVNCTKDGRDFVNEDLGKYDAFVFETEGDLIKEKSKDNQPPMSAEGKKALLEAIAGGKGFVGSHCASDTFHSAALITRNRNRWRSGIPTSRCWAASSSATTLSRRPGCGWWTPASRGSRGCRTSS